MTQTDARALAQQQANETRHPMELWEHVGGKTPARTILPQGRWVVIDGAVVDGQRVESEPKWVWAKRGIVEPVQD